MANFSVAFAFLMTSEDPTLSYRQVPDDPPGAFAISGINSHAFPVEFQRIASIPEADRALPVKGFYLTHFWNNWIAQLVSDEVAKRVFDAAVNMGQITAVRLLQKAIGAVSGITDGIDGIWGPLTLQRANACNPDLLAAAFRRARCEHYEAIAKAVPEEAKYLKGWLVRANK